MPLHLLYADTIVETLPLGPRLALGRSPSNDWVLTDRSVSSHHALVYRESQTVVLKDLGSSNGTWTRARGSETWRRLVKPEVLDHNTDIRLGHNTVLRWQADERSADALGPLVLHSLPAGLVVGVTSDHLPLPGVEGAVLVVHGDGGISVSLDGEEPIAVSVGAPFEVGGRSFELRADDDPTPATLKPAVAAFPYHLTVELEAGTANVVCAQSGRTVEFTTEARVALLYALGRRFTEHGAQSAWLDDHDASIAVWGRGYLEHGRNNLNVLIHRIRAKLEKQGLERWCVEKRPGQSRLRIEQVLLR